MVKILRNCGLFSQVPFLYAHLQCMNLPINPHLHQHLAIISLFNMALLVGNNTKEDSTRGHHQIVNNKIRLIMFFAAEDGKALYSQEKQDQELTVAQIMNSL